MGSHAVVPGGRGGRSPPQVGTRCGGSATLGRERDLRMVVGVVVGVLSGGGNGGSSSVVPLRWSLRPVISHRVPGVGCSLAQHSPFALQRLGQSPSPVG